MTDGPRPHERNDIRVELVTSQDQLMQALAIRAICYVEEHGYSMHQTLDANDFHATHVMVYAGDEPIATARVRWFRDFAKIERTAFLRKWRHPKLIQRAGQFIFDHAAAKGYDRVLTHAQPAYAAVWRRYLGFRVVEAKAPLSFAGHAEPYVELVKTVSVPDDAIGLDTDIATLFRIEGAWDAASRYEAQP